MSDLPPGWEWATVGEVVDVLDSRRVPVNATERAARPGSVPYFGATGQVGWIDEAIFDEQLVLLGEDGAPFLDPSKPKAFLISGPSWVNNHAHVLRAVEDATTNGFLRHALNATDYRPFVNGTTRLKLTQKSMRAMPIPLPPRAEQVRIIATLEEHLSHLDAAEALLRNVGQQLAVLEQRLIDAAADGDAVPLGSLLREPLRNGMSARASTDGSVRVVTITTVTRSEFTDAHTKMITPGARPIDDLWMQPGDIFVQRSNTPELVGTAALYDGPGDWAIFPDLLIRVRCNDLIDSAYLATVLRSTRLRRFFTSHAQGIAGSMPKISQPTVESAPIPLPSLTRQREILGELQAQTESLRATRHVLTQAAARATALRQSILAAAFSGKLVPQDPSDEPASALLERIRAEHTTTKPTRRPKAKTWVRSRVPRCGGTHAC